jgi:hypothetical protein
MSAMVSVNAQKKGGLWAHPIGSISGIASSGGLFGMSLGMTTAKERAVVGDTGIL